MNPKLKDVNLESFQNLPVSTKCKYTPALGHYLMSIEEYYYGISLYSISDFYVELWYVIKEQTIIKIRAYRHLTPYSPFLRRIKLDDISKDEAH